MENKLFEELYKAIAIWWYGMIGGVALYLNQVRKWKAFKPTMFFINVLLAWWIGWLVDGMIADDITIRLQLISISWFLAYPILDFIEDKWLNYLIKRILWK